MEIRITYKHVSMSNDEGPNRLVINSPEAFYNLKYKYNTQHDYTYVEIFIHFDHNDSVCMRRMVPAHRFGKSIMNLIKQAIADYHLQELGNSEVNNEY